MSACSSTDTGQDGLPDTPFCESIVSGSSPVINSGSDGAQSSSFPKPETPVINKLLLLERRYSGSTSQSDGTPPLTNSATKKLRDLPHTTTLEGCVAYVDVWSSDGTDNRSCVFRNFLMRMGATVVRKFTKQYPVTHVVFKDGHKSVLQKAEKRNVKVVTCFWVDRCRVLQKWVNEDDYLFDPTNYKPPKRFVEMQPQDPEDAIIRSAERMKRRKARFAKKNAHIMFQSPLATRSCNGTPNGGSNTPRGNATGLKNPIYVADTPYHPPSPYLFFNPSIIEETPLTDSLRRKMQRMKEGKRVFSPPSSDDEDMDATTRNVAIPPTVNEADDKIKFSPVADTQHFVKRPWRDSDLPPPKFDVSCDEIPETQFVSEDRPGDCVADVPDLLPPPLPDHNDKCAERTVHCNEDMELTGVAHLPEVSQTGPEDMELTAVAHLPVVNQTSPETGDKCEENENITLAPDTPDSFSALHLHLTAKSLPSDGDTTVLESEASNLEASMTPFLKKDTPVEQVLKPKKKRTSQKKMRKLLHDEDCIEEPASILLSPRTPSHRNSIALPELGFSSYKTITQSGRFFGRLPSASISDYSMTSSCVMSPRMRPASQSTDYDHEDFDSSAQDGISLRQVPVSNNHLGLYDRIKMNRRKSSFVRATEKTSVSKVEFDVGKRKRRRSAGSDKSSSESDTSHNQPKKKTMKSAAAAPERSLFCSQTAISFFEGVKKRRSVQDFKSPIISNGISKRSTKGHSTTSVIVLTNFHSDERFEMHQTVRSLSGFRISSTVRDHTTHVVCGAARRTLNVLRAVAKGLWLLSRNWVTDSKSAGFWLEEESYEIPDLFPAAQKNRKCRQRCSTWKNKLFADIGLVYVADTTNPPREELQELILLCGGKTVGSPRRAAICVGNPGRIIPEIPVVNETWVLDCISQNVLCEFDSYLIPEDMN